MLAFSNQQTLLCVPITAAGLLGHSQKLGLLIAISNHRTIVSTRCNSAKHWQYWFRHLYRMNVEGGLLPRPSFQDRAAHQHNLASSAVTGQHLCKWACSFLTLKCTPFSPHPCILQIIFMPDSLWPTNSTFQNIATRNNPKWENNF